MRILAHSCTIFLALAAGCAGAASTSSTGSTGAPPAEPAIQSVAVGASRAVAEIPYRFYLEAQHTLVRYLPPGPRLVDLWFRIGTAGLTEAQRDTLDEGRLTASIRSRSVDVIVPVRRGAYLSLPEIQDAYDERGEIVIGGSWRPWLSVWWTLRVPESRRMPYADIARAREQIGAVQRRVSAYHARLQGVRRSPYDGIKACFLDGSGAILVEGRAVADAVEGSCKVLFLDPAREGRNETVEFAGPLDVVSFVDRRYYRVEK